MFNTRTCCTVGISAINLIKILVWVELPFLSCGVAAQNTLTKGEPPFTVSYMPGLNMISVQCDGKQLPNNAKMIQSMLLERYLPQSRQVIATLSSFDGVVKLENQEQNGRNRPSKTVGSGRGAGKSLGRKDEIYVSGRFDSENTKLTYLGILLRPAYFGTQTVIQIGCEISFIKKSGRTGVASSSVNVSFVELERAYKVQQTPPTVDAVENIGNEEKLASLPSSSESSSSPSASSSSSSSNEGTFSIASVDKQMLLLFIMALLAFILFIVCVVLIVNRVQRNRKQKERMSVYRRSGYESRARAESGSVSIYADIKEEELEGGPVPPPPLSWTYHPGMGGEGRGTLLPPYNKHRPNSEGQYIKEDVGYGSEASTNYGRPPGDVEKIAK